MIVSKSRRRSRSSTSAKTAWVPDALVLRLPPGFTALASQPLMNDQGFDSIERQGAQLRGTFAPGRHDLEFRWQLPYHDEHDVAFDVGLPPHVATMRVMVAARPETTLAVPEFPEPERLADRQGQRVLFTERQLRPEHPLTSVHVIIAGLVAPSFARFVASGMAALTTLFGLVLGFRRSTRPRVGVDKLRADLLGAVADLESARLRGDVGPRTYERARRGSWTLSPSRWMSKVDDSSRDHRLCGKHPG